VLIVRPTYFEGDEGSLIPLILNISPSIEIMPDIKKGIPIKKAKSGITERVITKANTIQSEIIETWNAALECEYFLLLCIINTCLKDQN